MTLPVASAIKIEVAGNIVGGDEWRNVYHSTPPATFDDAWAGAAGGDIGAAYAAMAAYMHPDTTLNSITFYDLRTQPNPVMFGSVTPVAIGTSASDALPPNLASCVSWRTATAGRSGHGRTYLGGFAENANTAEGGPLNTFLDTVDDFAAAMLASTDFELAIVSYFTGHTYGGSTGHKTIPTPRATPLVHPVVSSGTSPRWNTMRSRSNGR